uniref:SecA DEAD-like N-terminal domain-containing protein n=1 Tax=Ditylenchus dipsaci TaxID=166011 RepID=A0A915EFM2_9BILA
MYHIWVTQYSTFTSNVGVFEMFVFACNQLIVHRAAQLHCRYKPWLTQILALWQFLVTEKNKGLLEQMKTGEGKSLETAMTLAVFALLGRKPDVCTSSLILLKGMRRVETFLRDPGLKAAHNICEKNDNNRKECT